jgi:hypothetical protein
LLPTCLPDFVFSLLLQQLVDFSILGCVLPSSLVLHRPGRPPVRISHLSIGICVFSGMVCPLFSSLLIVARSNASRSGNQQAAAEEP